MFFSRGICDVPGIPGLQTMTSPAPPPPPPVVEPAVVFPDPEVLPGPAVVEAVSEPDPLPLTAPCPPEPGPPVAGFMLFVSPTDPEHPAESKAARSKPVDPVRVAMSFIVSPASLRGPKSPCDSCNLAGFQNRVLALHVFLSGEDRYPMVDLF